eukprot:TRINITY_DN3076_c0_g3_i1.p2 TRINITY_DN3076_c0_g3~~TRINITY_DN3076_c0_g3_i1.p2  ORF type:complete len:186 (-),score=78.28 TRINITY_DN3076_c0_g3_i1:584-1141(-)
MMCLQLKAFDLSSRTTNTDVTFIYDSDASVYIAANQSPSLDDSSWNKLQFNFTNNCSRCQFTYSLPPAYWGFLIQWGAYLIQSKQNITLLIPPAPSSAPTSAAPTSAPTAAPTSAPTAAPTSAPTTAPTAAPTTAPTAAPTSAPTAAPTTAPTSAPTPVPTQWDNSGSSLSVGALAILLVSFLLM